MKIFGVPFIIETLTYRLQALFMSHCFPKLRPFFIFYTLWIWWATMYLSHHYAVDLIGGSLRKRHKVCYQLGIWLTSMQWLRLFSTSQRLGFSLEYNQTNSCVG